MSDLKVGDLVRLPTDPEAYANVSIDDSYGLTETEVEAMTSDEPRELTNEEKAAALGGKVGTLDDIIEGGDWPTGLVDVKVRDPEEPEGVLVPIAVGVPLSTLSPATA